MVEVKFIEHCDPCNSFEIFTDGCYINLCNETRKSISDEDPEECLITQITIEDAEYLVEELKRKILEAKLNNHLNKGGKNG